MPPYCLYNTNSRMHISRLLTFLFFTFCLSSLSASALDRQPNEDYRARRLALAQKLNGGIAVIFAATESEGPNATNGFRQDNNFFYLSGSTEPGAALLI